MASGLGSLIVRLGLDAADFIGGATKAEQQLAKLDAAAKRNAASINRQVAEYQKQAATLGLSSREVALYNLRLKGATDAQIKAADAALRSREAHDEWNATARNVGLVAGLAAAGIVGMVKAAIDGADHLKDLSKATGLSVEFLGGLGFAATKAGSDLDGAAAAVGKLNLAIAKARSGDEEKAFAFKAVGLDQLIKDGASAEKVLVALADKFAGYSDEPETAALANEFFGKSYQSLLPLLKDGGRALQDNIDRYREHGGVTKELADRSDEFNDTLADIGLTISGASRSLAAELLPGMQAVAEALRDSRDEGGLLSLVMGGVRNVFETLVVVGANVIYVFKQTGIEIGGIAAQLAALLRFDLTGFSAISDAMKEDAERARKELDEFEQRILNRGAGGDRPQPAFSDARYAAQNAPRQRAPSLPGGKKGAKEKDDTLAQLRRQLDDQLRLIRAFEDQRRDAVEYAQRYLDEAYDAGTVSLRENLDEQRRLREVGLQSTLDSLDREVAARRSFIDSLPKTAKDSERIQAETALKDAIDKRSAAAAKGAQDSVLALQQEAKQVRDLQRQYADFTTELKTLRGDDAGAAQDRINRQVEEARRLQQQAGGNPADVEEYRVRLQQQEQINEANLQAGRIREQQSIIEDEIAIKVQRGQIGELEQLRQIGVVRQQAVTVLEQQVQAQEAAARASGNPDLILNAQRARVELEKLKAAADPLAEKFERIFGDSFSSQFEEVLNGTKSVKDAFKDMANAWVREINHMIAQDAAKQLFGQGGPLGFLSRGAAGLFGGGGLGAAGASNILGLPAGTVGARDLTSASNGATIALNALALAANGAAGAIGGPSAVVGRTDILGTLLGGRGGFQVFDRGGIGIGTTQPTPERDILRRIEAGTDPAAEVGAFTSAIREAVPEVTVLGTGAADTAGSIIDLPSAFGDLLSNVGRSIGDLLGGLGGGSSGAFDLLSLFSSFGGFFADGGRPPQGRVSVVGERGPELFVPDQTGTVVPLDHPIPPAAAGLLGMAPDLRAAGKAAVADPAEQMVRAGAAERPAALPAPLRPLQEVGRRPGAAQPAAASVVPARVAAATAPAAEPAASTWLRIAGAVLGAPRVRSSAEVLKRGRSDSILPFGAGAPGAGGEAGAAGLPGAGGSAAVLLGFDDPAAPGFGLPVATGRTDSAEVPSTSTDQAERQRDSDIAIGMLSRRARSALTSRFGGFFADGGDPPMGKVSIVGEDGPELFVPRGTGGTIVPLDRPLDRRLAQQIMPGASVQEVSLALASVMGSGVGHRLMSSAAVAGPIGFFADGGRPPVGRASLVGERGRELFVPSAFSSNYLRTLPSDGGGQSVSTSNFTQTNNWIVHAPLDRRTQEQMASEQSRRALASRFRGSA